MTSIECGEKTTSMKLDVFRLDREEIAAMKKGTNLYRCIGIPPAMVCFGITKVISNLGYIPKHPALYVASAFSGYAGGTLAYANLWAKKYLALNYSERTEYIKNSQKTHGMRSPMPSRTEFRDRESTIPLMEEIDDDTFESPLNERLHGGKSWDEIRRESRQEHSSTTNGKGILNESPQQQGENSWDDIRRQSRQPIVHSPPSNRERPSFDDLRLERLRLRKKPTGPFVKNNGGDNDDDDNK